MKEKERRWIKYDYKRCKYLTYKLQIITYILNVDKFTSITMSNHNFLIEINHDLIKCKEIIGSTVDKIID